MKNSEGNVHKIIVNGIEWYLKCLSSNDIVFMNSTFRSALKLLMQIVQIVFWRESGSKGNFKHTYIYRYISFFSSEYDFYV